MKENRSESLLARLETDIPLGTELEPRVGHRKTVPPAFLPSPICPIPPPIAHPPFFPFPSFAANQKSLQSNLSTGFEMEKSRARSNNTPFLSIIVNVPPFDTQSRETRDSKVASSIQLFEKEGEDLRSSRRGKKGRKGRVEGRKVTREGKVWNNTMEESTFDPIQLSNLSTRFSSFSFEREEKSITIFPARAHDCEGWPSFSNGKLETWSK